MKMVFRPLRDSYNNTAIPEMEWERTQDGDVKFILHGGENGNMRHITISENDWEKLVKSL